MLRINKYIYIGLYIYLFHKNLNCTVTWMKYIHYILFYSKYVVKFVLHALLWDHMAFKSLKFGTEVFYLRIFLLETQAENSVNFLLRTALREKNIEFCIRNSTTKHACRLLLQYRVKNSAVIACSKVTVSASP